MTTISTTETTCLLEAACPECAAAVPFSRPPLNGEIAQCNGCGCELEVTILEPLTLEVAPEVEEDWGE